MGRILLIPVVAIAAAGGWLAWTAFYPAGPSNSPKVAFVVQRGQTGPDLARAFEKQGIISSPRAFLWLGKVTGQWKKVKVGEYELSASMAPLQIFSVITSGISIAYPFTIREGENLYEIADELESLKLSKRAEFIALAKDPELMRSLGFRPPLPPSLEGYLFPDTYHFNKAMGTIDIITAMYKRFTQVWTGELDGRAEKLGFTRHQALTLASMVEKETGASQERPMISSVFHNRLRKRMRLESDPTTIYGIWERYKGNIHREDLRTPTPYNTYTLSGLPVGPIGNPGKEAIEAALSPAKSEFLFFVSHNDGTHEFTRSFGEHQAAVRKFQLDPKAREGKSWRNLVKDRQSLAGPSRSAASR